MTYTRQQREVEDSVGTQLLNIARVAALGPAPARGSRPEPVAGLRRLPAGAAALAAIQDETLLTSPITILSGPPARPPEAPGWSSPAAARAARAIAYPLAPELIEPMGWTLGDGVARYTRVYRHQGGLWISGFAPILDAQGRPEALLHVAYPVEIYLDRLHELRNTLLLASGGGGRRHARARAPGPPPLDTADRPPDGRGLARRGRGPVPAAPRDVAGRGRPAGSGWSGRSSGSSGTTVRGRPPSSRLSGLIAPSSGRALHQRYRCGEKPDGPQGEPRLPSRGVPALRDHDRGELPRVLRRDLRALPAGDPRPVKPASSQPSRSNRTGRRSGSSARA